MVSGAMDNPVREPSEIDPPVLKAVPYPHPALQFTYPIPYGAILHDGGVQFVVFSRSATAMRLLLYDRVDDAEPSEVVAVQPRHRPLGRRVEHLRARRRFRDSSITFKPTGRSIPSRGSGSTAERG